MSSPQKSKTVPASFLDDPTLRKIFKAAQAATERELSPFYKEIHECEQLTARDFAVRINARD